MKATLKAIEYYLNQNKAAYFPQVKTIKEYAGEIADAIKDNQVVKMRDILPAVYILFIDGTPAAEEPEFQFDLLIVTETKTFEREANQESNLDISDGIIKAFGNEPGWQYNSLPYLVDREQLKCRTLLSDNKYDVKLINLYISILS
jgi:hypothetical protein